MIRDVAAFTLALAIVLAAGLIANKAISKTAYDLHQMDRTPQ